MHAEVVNKHTWGYTWPQESYVAMVIQGANV
jgi:hypothetical protein